MQPKSLHARTRQASGKCGARELRGKGAVPAILYGGDGAPVSVAVDSRQFGSVVHGRGGEHAIVQLDIEDQPELSSPALVKDVQHDPIHGEIVHADFMRIHLDRRITTVVSVRLEGHAAGVLQGGILDQNLRNVEVECLALDVPDEIVVDVTELKMGESIHVRELRTSENVTILTAQERTVVSMLVPRVVKEEIEGEAEEAAEGEEGEEAAPEVVGEKKEGEDK